MEKELCLKFLVHLHKYSTSVLQKPHINETDITYINNEIENFLRKLDKGAAAEYDAAGALNAIQKIPAESMGDKAVLVSKFVLKAKFKWIHLLFGGKDEAHLKREAKVSEFREKVKKVLAVIEYSR
jgi:hypothetical protein